MAFLFRSAAAISIIMCAPLAMADDKDKSPELREETRCFPAENIVKFISRFDGLKDSQRDSVDSNFNPSVEILDDGALPDRLYFKSGTVEETVLMEEDGQLPTFISRAKTADEETEICIQDKSRAGTPVDSPGAGLSMSFNIRYINRDGSYDMAELADGLKDGKSFYKKMVGGPAALLVPNMTHLVVSYEDEQVTPQIEAFNGDVRIDGLVTEPFDGAYVVTFKDLKKLGATHLKISGGDHFISPAPSIKTMKKFGIGGGG